MFAVNVLKPVTPVPSEVASEPAPWFLMSVMNVLLVKNDAGVEAAVPPFTVCDPFLEPVNAAVKTGTATWAPSAVIGVKQLGVVTPFGLVGPGAPPQAVVAAAARLAKSETGVVAVEVCARSPVSFSAATQAAAFDVQVLRLSAALLNSFKKPFSKMFTSLMLNKPERPTP